MGITLTNTLAMSAAHNVAMNQLALGTSLKRLSTGFRINEAKDDPAGLIASELLRSEKAQVSAAMNNAQRADTVLATADGGLQEMSNLLINLQELVVASANTGGISDDELAANQLQVDSILQTINKMSNDTAFGGRKLLTGELGFTVSAAPNNPLQNLQIHNAAVGATGGQSFYVQLLASAQHASLTFTAGTNGLNGAVNLALAGVNGNVNLSFASSVKASAIANAVNQLSGATGVTASANATSVAFISTGYGSSQFVSVQSNSANFQPTTNSSSSGGVSSAHGRDAQVVVNGQPAEADGLSVKLASDSIDATFLIEPTKNTTGRATTFAVTGGGATFSLAPHADSGGYATIGLPDVRTGALGFINSNGTGFTLNDLGSWGNASLASGKGEIAQKVVGGAIKELSTLRGRIGAFRKYTVQSELNALGVTFENLSSAESQIRDTDFAVETAELARRQILLQSSQSALSAANENQKIILKLLGG